MRFALLGADTESQALADAAVAAGHFVAWREAPAAEDSTAWEALLDSESADAILVGAGGDAPDLRARQMQDLAKLGRPVLAVHPVVPSVISYFEIDMARTESDALVQHFNPLVESPHVALLAEFVRQGHPQLGAIEQITSTRQLADRSREVVLWHFARDVELLARLAGRMDRVGAHAAMSDPEVAYASLSVQLLGPQQVPVRWAVEPPGGGAPLAVTLIFQQGRATLLFDAEGTATELIEQGAAGETRTPQSGESPARSAIDHFVTAIGADNGSASTWTTALDAMELADSIEISLRRGRMIDVHHRELTETLAFKGVMSAAGCGVLVVLVPAVLALGWIAGLFGIPFSHYWPHLLLVLLAAFLGLQLLPKLIAPSGRARGRLPGTNGDSEGDFAAESD